MPPPPDPERTPTGRDAARRAIEAVLREQQEQRRRQAPPPEPPPRARGSQVAILLVLTVLAVSFWASPPGWARPDPLPHPSSERMEAGLRMDMWVTVQRIRSFQEDRGRLPVVLGEAAPRAADDLDLRYEPLSPEAFRLVGSRGDVEIVYDSADPAEGLVEPARTVIGGGTGP